MSTASSARPVVRSARKALAAVVCVLLAVGASVVWAAAAPARPASAATPVDITGTGSSFAAPALRQWAAQVDTLDGLSINFSPSSSVLGLNEYAQNLVNFAASDIGYSTGQANYTPSGSQVPFQYMPDVGGALCMAYNLDSPTGQAITGLRLDPQTLLDIFTGQIKTWNDPKIAADQTPSVAAQLPSFPITADVRSDGAGESYIFSDYFYTLYQSQWNAFTGAMGAKAGPQAIWPSVGVGQSQVGPYDLSLTPSWAGSDAVIQAVKDDAGSSTNTNNSITYVETAYAQLNNLPCAQILNPSGAWVQPSEQGDAIALTQDQLEPDLEQILTGVFLNSNPLSYPISAYSYLITQEAQTSPGVGATLGDYVKFIACQGQQSAGPLGYTPIPPNLVQDDFDAVNRINGAATLPAPNGSNCPNPYLTGQLPLPGEPIQIGQAGASGTVPGTSTAAGTAAGGAGATSGAAAGGGGNASGGSAGSSSNPSTAAAVAAIQAKIAQAEKEGKAHVGSVQAVGVGLVNAVDHLLSAPFSPGQIWLWIFLLLGVFVGIPVVISLVSRRRQARMTERGEQ